MTRRTSTDVRGGCWGVPVIGRSQKPKRELPDAGQLPGLQDTPRKVQASVPYWKNAQLTRFGRGRQSAGGVLRDLCRGEG